MRKCANAVGCGDGEVAMPMQAHILDGWRLSFEDGKEGAEFAQKLLICSLQSGSLEDHQEARLILASAQIRCGEFDAARSSLEALVEEFVALEDAQRLVMTQALLANCFHTQGHREAAWSTFRQIVPEQIEALEPFAQFVYFNAKALIYTFDPELLADALSAHVRLIAIARQLGMSWLVIRAIGYIALYQSLVGLSEDVVTLMAEVQAIRRPLTVNRPLHLCVCANSFIQAHLELGLAYDLSDDLTAFGDWLDDDLTALDRWSAGRYMLSVTLLLLRGDRIDEATDWLTRAQEKLSDVPPHFVGLSLDWARGLLLKAVGDPTGAESIWFQALSGPQRAHHHAYFLTELLANALAGQGRHDEANRWYGQHIEFAKRRTRLAAKVNFAVAQGRQELRRLEREKQLASLKHQMSERARQDLQAVNEQLRVRIAEVELLQAQLREQSVRDVLTGLHNRRHLHEVLPQQMARARRSGEPLVVAIIDLDHFKRVNDTWGHPMGDAVLRETGTFLSSRLRASDIACRFGGEEFCILFSGATEGQAVQRLQDLLEDYRALTVQCGSHTISHRTFSCGVVELGDEMELEQLLSCADQALYRAKNGGRNAVVAYQSSVCSAPSAAG